MPTRLRAHLDGLRTRGEAALGLFVTCGFPEPSATVPLLHALAEGGADFLELGMPFSDPLGEGPTIQHASARALAHGTTITDCLAAAAAFRATSEKPVLLMGYANPVLRYGLARFCDDAARAGVDGLILPDLPPEEGDDLDARAADAGLAVVYLIAPNTSDERVRLVDRRSTGFVYATSVTGLTGTGLGDAAATATYLTRARGLVENNPLLVGFGIQSAGDARRLATSTDGFIVGSALLREVERLWDGCPELTESERLGRVRDWARALKADSVPAPTAP